MKVLFLTSWYPSNNAPIEGIFIKKHALALAQHCDVAVLAIRSESGKNISDYHKDRGIHEIIVHTNTKKQLIKFSLFGDIRKSIKYFLSFQSGYKIVQDRFGEPDLIALNIIYPVGLIFLFYNIFKRKPYIIFEHHTEYLESSGIFKNRNYIIKFLMRYLGAHAKKIIVVSTSLKNSMINNGFINAYTVVPNIVEIANSENLISEKIENHALSLKNYKNKIIFHVSSLKNEQKNITGLLDGIWELASKRNDFIFIVAGSGSDQKKVESYAAELNLLNKYVFFLGFINNATLRYMYENCSFFVLNSNYETFSVVTAEALLCGKPVIITRCGGPEEFVTEECGITIEPQNKNQLITALGFMLDGYKNYDSQKIKKYAENIFDSEKIGAKIYEICLVVKNNLDNQIVSIK